MSLAVERPDPPELGTQNPAEYEDASDTGTDEYRREDLEAFLQEGAWEQAWDEWSTHTDLTEEEYAIAEDLGLIEEFDFFWDDFADRVGYHAPGIPEDWRERELHPELNSWDAVSSINASMTELGQITCEVLKNDYIDWEADYEPPEDLPDFE